MKQIQHVIRIEKPDIIHIHSTFAGAFVRLPLIFKKIDLKLYIVLMAGHLLWK